MGSNQLALARWSDLGGDSVVVMGGKHEHHCGVLALEVRLQRLRRPRRRLQRASVKTTRTLATLPEAVQGWLRISPWSLLLRPTAHSVLAPGKVAAAVAESLNTPWLFTVHDLPF